MDLCCKTIDTNGKKYLELKKQQIFYEFNLFIDIGEL